MSVPLSGALSWLENPPQSSIWRGSLLPEIQLPRRIAVRSAAARCQTPPPRQATMAQQQVDISAMSLEQLNTYKGQFENEIKQLPVWKSTSASGARPGSVER